VGQNKMPKKNPYSDNLFVPKKILQGMVEVSLVVVWLGKW